ncbi:MAG: DMT family transporter [Bacteroidota bacterium]
MMVQWLIFLLLCLVWGSSFILMKLGLVALSPLEVAGLRLLSAGIVLTPFFFEAWKKTNLKTKIFAVLIGLLGSFFPGILFCMAETTLHSSIAGVLNATTPLFVMIVGFLLFRRAVQLIQVTGIMVGFLGVLLLFYPSISVQDGSFTAKALLILLATIMYGFNVNIANLHLSSTAPLHVASLSLVMLIPVDLFILVLQGFFSKDFSAISLQKAAISSVVLGVFGTAMATWLFYVLMQRSGPLFSSMVTYGIPFVALGWGMLAGEAITGIALLALLLILLGVYLVNKKKSP